MKRYVVLACLCMSLGAGSVRAADALWLGGDGDWFDAANWFPSVPNVVNGLVPAIKASGTITLDGHLTGNDAVVQWYQETGDSTFNSVDHYIDIQSDLDIAVTYGSKCMFHFRSFYAPAELYVSNDLNITIPSYGTRGFPTVLVNGTQAAAHFLGNIDLVITTNNLSVQPSSSTFLLRNYQEAKIYAQNGVYIDMVSGTNQWGGSITNRGILRYSGWDNRHYGTMFVGRAKDASGVWSTNLNSFFTLTDGAYLDIETTYHEPVADFSRTLVHMIGTNDWNGEFEDITLVGDSVGFGEWTSETNYASYTGAPDVWYYQLEQVAVDGDGIPNDIILNVTSNAPPGPTLSIALGVNAVTVTSEDLPASGTNYLQSIADLAATNWTDIGQVSGVTSNSWLIAPLVNSWESYRVENVD